MRLASRSSASFSVVVESVSSEAACPIMATVFGVRAEASRK